MKKVIIFIISGLTYRLFELMWSGNSHWIMILVGGIGFMIISRINDQLSWDMSFILQSTIITMAIVWIEFIAGCILNLWLKLSIWDYSGMFFNLLGQVCLFYAVIWFFLSIFVILADDYFKWKLFNGEKPKYKFLWFDL